MTLPMKGLTMKTILAAAAIATLSAPATFAADAVVRHPIPNSTFPISQAIEIPPGATRVLVSGTVPTKVDEAADAKSSGAYGGDTEGQTVNVLKSIEDKLKALGLGMGDVVKMQVYLVAPAEGQPMDFAGFMKGYTQFFGTETQKNLPTRSVFEVAGLANPGYLVEIEVEAVRP
ncbi:endoribonuclease L-PSP [Paracoccus sanguinis]|nr:endoribonuclease L-PSP [Paracoccus sanguinis]